eukprot:gene4845-6792_t
MSYFSEIFLVIILFPICFGLNNIFISFKNLKSKSKIAVFASFPPLVTKQSNLHDYDFSNLKSLDDRCERLSSRESEFLLSFWSERLQCFQIYPKSNSTTVSITTTCMTISTILSNPSHWNSIMSWESSENEKKISLKSIVATLMNAPWRGDSFQNPVLLSTLCQLKVFDKSDPKFYEAVDLLLEQRSRLSLHRTQPLSAYLRYQNVQALLSIVNNKCVPESLVGSNMIGYALERANMVSFDELCRQLAFYSVGDSANFDEIILSYSLLTYWETSQSLFLSSFARGVVPLTNIKLVEQALKVIFESQSTDGTWSKGEPINKIGESNSNRDIGNNYVFFFDMISSIIESIGETQPELLTPYIGHLERSILWAESNIQEEMLPDKIDPITNRKYGAVVKGWRSNHLGTGGAVAWCTAQVFSGITSIRKLLRSLITSSIIAEFKGKEQPKNKRKGNSKDWINLMDADLELAGVKTTLKEELFSRLLNPQAKKEREVLTSILGSTSLNDEESTNSGMYSPPLYSAILFGPPGTAKTTICTSIANYLGWNFLTIDTACFLADGLENIASRMSYIFSRLTALERTIILFDEIEEFCLDRENPSLAMESRLLTTAMLTQLNDLRRKQASVFIVATNRLRSFDAAVIRPGRFDMLLFVGTPNLDARVKRLETKLISTSISPTEQHNAVRLFREYHNIYWDNCRFLTFAENESLLTTVIDLAKRGMLTEDAIDQKVKSLLKTSTIQGTVKQEYIASESISRV